MNLLLLGYKWFILMKMIYIVPGKLKAFICYSCDNYSLATMVTRLSYKENES